MLSLVCKFQDGVPETIEALRKAGINFWMLTGDKQNTAIQIALSCNFISPGSYNHISCISFRICFVHFVQLSYIHVTNLPCMSEAIFS